MFGTFLLFILNTLATLSLVISIGVAIYYLIQANKGLHMPLQITDMLKSPTIMLSEEEFSETGNQDRVRCVQAVLATLGLMVLVLLLRLILA